MVLVRSSGRNDDGTQMVSKSGTVLAHWLMKGGLDEVVAISMLGSGAVDVLSGFSGSDSFRTT